MTEAVPNAVSSVIKADPTRRTWRRIAEQYGIALIAIVIAAIVRVALSSVLSGEASYLFFFPAVLIASAIGGWGPGIFATILGLLLGSASAAEFDTQCHRCDGGVGQARAYDRYGAGAR